jgi:SulP family sulfate permease
MRDVLALDSTGMHVLKDVVHRSRREGTLVLLADVHAQPRAALTASPIIDEIGRDNVFSSIELAVGYATQLDAVRHAAR